MFFTNSFLSLSDNIVTEKITSIGISLGDDADLIRNSVTLIKNVKKDRVQPMPVQMARDSQLEVESTVSSEFEEEDLTIDNFCDTFGDDMVGDYSNGLAIRSKSDSRCTHNSSKGTKKITKKGCPVQKKLFPQ
jgi:hypothetical protein